ncbi:MAG: Cupredoxin-like domain [Chloroflexota bacterium]|nr:Cupredoxin-like domain [Chloroflexota bacterium]
MRPGAAHRRTVFIFLPALALAAALVVLGACTAAALPSSSVSAAPSAVAVDVTNSPEPSTSASGSPAPLPTIAVVKVTPIPNAPDSKTIVKVVAAHVRWVPTTLAAPAGKVWHVRIDNQDGPPEHHNFVVASGKTFPERIYQSRNFNKGTFTFDVPALPAGKYLFICTVHPDVMTGTLELR